MNIKDTRNLTQRYIVLLRVPAGKNGAYAYVGNRGDEAEHRDIKPMFDLGHTRFVYYSARDVDSMKEVIADADVVVNLVSKTHPTGQPIQIDKFPYIGWQENFSIADVNVGIATENRPTLS